MMRWLGRWLLRVVVAIAAISLVAFAIDWTVYKLRGSPHSTVTVSQFMSVPLKGRKRSMTIWDSAERFLRRFSVSAGWAGTLLVSQATPEPVG